MFILTNNHENIYTNDLMNFPFVFFSYIWSYEVDV